MFNSFIISEESGYADAPGSMETSINVLHNGEHVVSSMNQEWWASPSVTAEPGYQAWGKALEEGELPALEALLDREGTPHSVSVFVEDWDGNYEGKTRMMAPKSPSASTSEARINTDAATRRLRSS